MAEIIADIEVPDTRLVTEATELVRKAADPVVYHHSRRVYFWASMRGRNRGWDVDPELLYVGALFHDLGLTDTYARTDQRFEIDGADEARRFLLQHDVPEDRARLVWEAIALHTTPEIPWHMAPEIALVTSGVEVDVLGIGYDEITAEEREAVVAAHPRPDFKNNILKEFTHGIAPRPGTTFGNVKADVLERFVPGFVRGNFVDTILQSPWAE
ncbi:HD domain-containing protein [Actinacidiphila glaucinigra]|uniref:HDIG domain-containing protein n=1 Tax=Actinacidiphila glaucinigra TaxID=235986 RepID=A0A239GBX9_9ACTN|nr:HD domain-containing protein [Actinacidiphila glaucinigra]SNS65554.1 HDIG domain-containing protein [Actinacidiphila glaucinigra]